MRRFRLHTLLSLVAAMSAAMGTCALRAQDDTGGRVVLVLPFDNHSGQPNIDWIGESFAETIGQRLHAAGFLTISRDDRIYALDHLGLPATFRPSRATTIRIAQTLDAQYVLVGSYTLQDGQISAQTQVLEVNQLKLSAPLTESAPLAQLLPLENKLAWRCVRSLDSKFNIALSSFVAASAPVKLDAYESYIRGVTATTADDRLKRLKTAVDLDPTEPEALLALGKTEYAALSYDAAAAALAKIPPSDPLALEANFYRGLARFNNAHYSDAEEAFTAVAARLPLPEVVNNQGVAQARQRKDGTALMQRASAADPQDPDYHFNVAVALRRRGDVAGARKEIDQSMKLRPNDAEAKELQAVLSGAETAPAGFDPQERIRRTYSEAAFRQAAFQMDQMRTAKNAVLPPDQQAAAFAQAGQDYLSQGLVLEAEREFLSALQADPRSWVAHLGLAQVRERTGNVADAHNEAQLSLNGRPTAAAYLVLARLDLQANQLASAASDVGNALRLESTNAAALAMKQALAARGTTLP